MSKHTPGPWTIGRVCCTHYLLEPHLELRLTSHEGGGDTKEANARLIAAAPELLGALQRVAAYLSMHDQSYWLSNADADSIRAAIAKARGEV